MKDFIATVIQHMCFSLLSCLGVFTNMSTIIFHRCANMVWITKGTKGPPLLMLRSFYKQRVLMVENVDGVTKSANSLYLKTGCYCRGRFI
jgi:hypothetical protein